jgi:hypothetical protein
MDKVVEDLPHLAAMLGHKQTSSKKRSHSIRQSHHIALKPSVESGDRVTEPLRGELDDVVRFSNFTPWILLC